MAERATDRRVLDGSLTLAWYFADEADPYADAVAQGLATREAVVPSLWRLEIANTLVVGERRRRSTQAQAAAFLARLERLPIVTDDQTDARAWGETIRLARAHTGRDMVAVCTDHAFFSTADWFIGGTAMHAGIPAAIREMTVGFRYNDLASVESLLEQHKGPMLFGEFSNADAYFAPVCMRIRTYALPVPGAITEYMARVCALPGVKAWIADALAEQDFLDFEEPYRTGR